MTDEELRTLVANLVTATASNTEAITKQSEAAAIQAQGLASLQASAIKPGSKY
jgi:hypothetical protein